MENPQKQKATTEQERAEKLARKQVLLEWKAPEFIYYEKGRNWFIWAAVVFTGLIAYAIFALRSVISTITFAALFIMVYLFAQKKPQELRFAITAHGIIHGEEYYAFKDVKAFWLEYEPPHVKELHLEINRVLGPLVTVQLLDTNPLKVRELLIDKVKEDEKLTNGLSDALARLLRF